MCCGASILLVINSKIFRKNLAKFKLPKAKDGLSAIRNISNDDPFDVIRKAIPLKVPCLLLFQH